MSTKENPGKYDCLEKAEPDEPYFVLLARDIEAATAIRDWAMRSRHAQPLEKLKEALSCANAMDSWRSIKETANVLNALEPTSNVPPATPAAPAKRRPAGGGDSKKATAKKAPATADPNKPKRGPGRPKGSTNKPKTDAPSLV